MIRITTLAVASVALAVSAAGADAQEPVRRGRQPTIEIRGQVPTPQIVTVRPREVPQYSRKILSPAFFDRDFWPSILPAYLLVPKRAITGSSPVDSLLVPSDTGALAPPALPVQFRNAPAPTPADTGQRVPPTMPDTARPPGAGTPE